MKKIIVVMSIFLFFFGIVIFSQLVGISWSKKEIFRSCQPNEINYQSSDPYCLSTIKQRQTLGSIYFIWVAKKIEPNYGHAINYPNPHILSEQEFRDLKINWTAEGIEVEGYLNTKIFIPKKNFIGGR